MVDYIKSSLKKIELIYCIILFAILFAFSLLSFVVFPTADDISVMLYNNDKGVSNIFDAFFMNHRSRADSINFTFAHHMVRGLVPAQFSLLAHRITIFIMFWCFVASIWYFIKTISKYFFPLNSTIVVAISLTIAFLSVNNAISPAQNFFWWSGVINYSLIFASILFLTSFILELYNNDNIARIGQVTRHGVSILLLIFITGSQQGGGCY